MITSYIDDDVISVESLSLSQGERQRQRQRDRDRETELGWHLSDGE